MREAAPLPLADRRVAVWLAIVTFAVYAWFYSGGGWNQNAQFDLTRALVERHTLAIDAYAGNTGDVSRGNGHVYVNKSPGLSFLAAIPYAPLYAFEGDVASTPHALTLNNYICTLICVALPGALIPVMLFAYARRRGIDARWAAIVALTTSLGTQLLPYATLLMIVVPCAALLLFAFTTRSAVAAGLAIGIAATMNYLCVPVVLFVAFLRGWRVLAGAIAPLAALAAYQHAAFGSMFRTSIATMDERFVDPHALFGVITPPSLDALYGITISPYRGLFFFAPVLLFAFAGGWSWFRSGEDRRELLAIAATCAVFFAFNVTFNGWEAGFGIGARYLVPLVPLLALAMLELRGRMQPLFIAVAALSFAINFASTAVDPQFSGSIPRPLTQYVVPLLVHGRFGDDVPLTPPWSARTFTGHTSVNRLAHDEAIVFQRHPPGSPESEWASFNLGETLFGAGELASLVPILALLALGLTYVGKLLRSIPRS